MMRIGLFLATNLAIMMLISMTFRLLGIEGLLMENGVDLDLNALLIYSAIIGFSGSLISLFISKWSAKRSMGVRVIEHPSDDVERWLLNVVEKQTRERGVGMPEVGIFEHPSPNAFATGWNRNNALVAVSTGLLHQMNRDEVEAVLAHEVSHVANGDMVTLLLIQGVINTFVVFLSRVIGHTVDRVVFKTERGYGPAYYFVSIVAEFVLGILAMVIVMWFSRWREFRADKGGADLAGRGKMIAALQCLQQAHQPDELPDEMAAFAINAGKVQKLFASHPPLEARIQALRSGS
jgi:heat shock protein HtpX